MVKETDYKRIGNESDLNKLSRGDLIRIAVEPKHPELGWYTRDGIYLGREGDKDTFIYQAKDAREKIRKVVSWRRERDQIEFTDEGFVLLNLAWNTVSIYGEEHRPSDQRYEGFRQLLIDAGGWQEPTAA